MATKQFPRPFSLKELALLGALLGTLGLIFVLASRAFVKPNFVVVMTDDQTFNDLSEMPKVQSLLRSKGTFFNHFYANQGICCPSRVNFLRGQYVHSTGISGNHRVGENGGFYPFHSSGKENSTLPVWLKDAGYRTGMFGKYLNEYYQGAETCYTPKGWDRFYAMVQYRYRNGDVCDNGNYEQFDGYTTDVLNEKAENFIRNSNLPFFLMVNPYAPHEAVPFSNMSADRHKDLFKDKRYPRTPAFDTATSGKPLWISNNDKLTNSEKDAIDEEYRNRLRSLQAVDEMVENLVDTLRDVNKLSNTYIIFVSDNGYHMGEFGMTPFKNTAYTEDTRLPLIVRGPGVNEGRVDDSLANMADLAPTIAELAGAIIPSFVEGRSLVPHLRAITPTNWRNVHLIEKRVKNSIPKYNALRSKTFLYIETDQESQGTFYEFYDLQADPYQLNNIYQRLSDETKSTLTTRLAGFVACSGSSCRTADDGRIDITYKSSGGNYKKSSSGSSPSGATGTISCSEPTYNSIDVDFSSSNIPSGNNVYTFRSSLNQRGGAWISESSNTTSSIYRSVGLTADTDYYFFLEYGTSEQSSEPIASVGPCRTSVYPGDPDWVIRSFASSPESPRILSYAQLDVSVGNDGGTDALGAYANIKIYTFTGGFRSQVPIQTRQWTVPVVCPGCTAPTLIEYFYGYAVGDYLAEVCLDITNVTNEADESNNCKSLVFRISP